MYLRLSQAQQEAWLEVIGEDRRKQREDEIVASVMDSIRLPKAEVVGDILDEDELDG
jgi:hypothetical protein